MNDMIGLPPDGASPSAQRRRAAAFWRPALFALGWLFVAVGIVGLFVPLLPGALFLILAAACFTRSSPRFEAWLTSHPRLGPPVRLWRERGAIPRRAKWLACGSLAVSWLILGASGVPPLAAASSFLLFGAVGIYIVTRPDG